MISHQDVAVEEDVEEAMRIMKVKAPQMSMMSTRDQHLDLP